MPDQGRAGDCRLREHGVVRGDVVGWRAYCACGWSETAATEQEGTEAVKAHLASGSVAFACICDGPPTEHSGVCMAWNEARIKNFNPKCPVHRPMAEAAIDRFLDEPYDEDAVDRQWWDAVRMMGVADA